MTLNLNLPPDVPVDRSRAGVLRVSVPMLGHLLRLPPGCEVVAVRITPGLVPVHYVELLIEGDPMPPRADGPAAPVMLLSRKEIRGEGEEREECVTSWFEHAPERAWIFSNWSEPVP
jgi:hypothetical protein